jgi:hypothetical protein
VIRARISAGRRTDEARAVLHPENPGFDTEASIRLVFHHSPSGPRWDIRDFRSQIRRGSVMMRENLHNMASEVDVLFVIMISH